MGMGWDCKPDDLKVSKQKHCDFIIISGCVRRGLWIRTKSPIGWYLFPNSVGTGLAKPLRILAKAVIHWLDGH